MKTTKRLLALLLALLTALSVPAVSFAAYSGSAYTKDTELAKKLTNVFNGKVKLFTNTDETFPIGSSIDIDYEYAWGKSYPDVGYGYQCFAYAQSVYYYLFDEIAGSDDRDLTRSEVVLRAKDKLLYRDLLAAGIGCGAYFRTTNNSDYSYNSAYGHSFILLTYDADTITILEGNSDYNGLVAIKVFTWYEFNEQRLNNQNRRLAFAIQPKRTRWSITAPAGAFSVGAVKNAAAANNGEDEVKLTWSKVSGATMYHIHRYSAESKVYEYYDTAYENEYIDSGLTMGRTYRYQIRAVKLIGGETLFGAFSAAVSAVPMAELPEKLSLPGYIDAEPGYCKLTLSWSRVRYANIYYIYQYSEKTKKYEYLTYVTEPVYTAEGLENGKPYSFKIRAVAKYPTVDTVYSDFSDEITATPALNPPGYLYADSGSHGVVELYWPESEGIVYYVYMFNEAKNAYEYIGASKEGYYEAKGLKSGKTYRFKVRSVLYLAGGERVYSGYSEEAWGEPGKLPGDLNGDDAVSSADARLALRYAVGLEYIEDWSTYLACDVNRDGEITSADARLILRRAVGLKDAEFRA